jgi:hypothetical protein
VVGTDGGHVAARPAADDDDVIVFHSEDTPFGEIMIASKDTCGPVS